MNALSSSRRNAIAAVAVGVVAVVLVIVVVSRGSSGGSSASANRPSTTTTGKPSSSSTVAGDSATSEAPADGAAASGAPAGYQPPPLPLNVQVSSTENLRDGDEVTVHVTPTDGSNIYGLEAFICKPDATYLLDADIRPTQTGKCITRPLSAASGDYVKVAAAAPYQVADLTIKVGVGTDTYTTSNGQTVTITCGPGDPCTLVLKLQVPDTFGFQAYPLTFA